MGVKLSKNILRTTPNEIREKLLLGRVAMKKGLIERDIEVDCVLTGMLCYRHTLLIGPPGTAKSLLVDSICAWTDLPKFDYLLTKFTDPFELFGPTDILALKEGKIQRVVEGMIPQACFLFLDEIFKSNSAVLNTLLKILNEGVFKYGNQKIRCPLKSCVEASNEMPSEKEELSALKDRFLITKTVRPIHGREARDRLMFGETLHPIFENRLTESDLEAAHKAAMKTAFTEDAKECMHAIMDELNKEGIFPSDRKTRQSIEGCRAYAYLNGANEVRDEHLAILAHILWNEPGEEEKKVGQIIARLATPLAHAVNDIMGTIDDVMEKNAPAEAVEKLNEIKTKLRMISACPERDQALNYVGLCIEDCYAKTVHKVNRF